MKMAEYVLMNERGINAIDRKSHIVTKSHKILCCSFVHNINIIYYIIILWSFYKATKMCDFVTL